MGQQPPGTAPSSSFLERFWPHLTAAAGALGLGAVAVLDAWHFHAWPANTDLTILLGAGGILTGTGAYVAGQRAA